ncbi:hypothetical protein E1B28_012600 [Marasmius oreades]|uniref:Uncharacterized protein n=1 Tax=Marasmius oreades TaxID=181124 RepID=A0A9P7RSJ7_9AGAR|nr:uncharacterized protein E1B28_012600 [Marasmius oreades]KAG7088628.1 hypothetical protein E1B28_012600 [Marasmius oreades]
MNIPTAQENPYTILRIKRKRNEEPLDALVIESAPRKKTKGGKGLFQFAQTVEDAVWQDEKQQREIQERITRLARAEGSNQSIISDSSTPSAPAVKPLPSDPSRRYTVIERESSNYPSQWDPSMPPPVLSARELQAQKAATDFKMYDAVLERSDEENGTDMDPEMEKIMPLLQAYLKMSNTPATPANDGDSDYVWDIFYHRPGARQHWTQTSTVGTVFVFSPRRYRCLFFPDSTVVALAFLP